jgi:hypothetical protein
VASTNDDQETALALPTHAPSSSGLLLGEILQHEEVARKRACAPLDLWRDTFY